MASGTDPRGGLTPPVLLAVNGTPAPAVSGGSRFWGLPDMPPGIPYPVYEDSDGIVRPYTFVCQLNLRDLAAAAPGNPLPHSGVLQFFAKIDRYLGRYGAASYVSGDVSPREAVKVLLWPATVELQPARLPESMRGHSLPRVTPRGLRVEYSTDITDVANGHMLFAPPYHREWAEWPAPYTRWQILLRIDSFDGDGFSLNFLDCGVLDFLISPSALRSARFDNVRGIVLST